ncbi:MAG: hypothetical protein MZW92_74010 [Comamonadaceae bacterium]|nr:hypothetical protein [Comamonadaceae bacterium]
MPHPIFGAGSTHGKAIKQFDERRPSMPGEHAATFGAGLAMLRRVPRGRRASAGLRAGGRRRADLARRRRPRRNRPLLAPERVASDAAARRAVPLGGGVTGTERRDADRLLLRPRRFRRLGAGRYVLAGLNNPQFQREPGRWQVRTVARATQSRCARWAASRCCPTSLQRGPGTRTATCCCCWPAALGGARRARRGDRRRADWADAGQPLAAICGATAGTARAGVLDRQRPHRRRPRLPEGHGLPRCRPLRQTLRHGLRRGRRHRRRHGAAGIRARGLPSLSDLYDEPVLEAWVPALRDRQERVVRRGCARGGGRAG